MKTRVEVLHDVDRAEQAAQLQVLPQVREGHVAEDLPAAGAVDPGRLDDVQRAALQAGQQDQHHERRPLPDQRDDRPPTAASLLIQSGCGGLSEPNSPQIQVSSAVEQAVLGVVERVLPQQRGRHRDDQERGDHHGPDRAPAAELAVEQQRDAQPEHQADQHDGDGQQDRRPDRVAHVDVGEHPREVVEPGEPALVGVVGVPVHERDDQRRHERQLGHDDHEDQGGQQRRPAGPVAGERRRAARRPGAAACGGARPASWRRAQREAHRGSPLSLRWRDR